MREKIVLSLGGSITVPDKVDIEYLKDFRELVKEFIDRYQFFIIVGGGALARQYQNAAKELGVDSEEFLDEIGIRATRLNAEVVRASFGDMAEADLINSEMDFGELEKSVVVGAGTHPGWSTDFVSVELAEKLGVKKIINLANLDYIFDKNPTEFLDAKALPKITWPEMWNIIGTEWIPGADIPFDQRATEKAEGNEMTVVLLNGKNIENLRNFLSGNDFTGSVISPVV